MDRLIYALVALASLGVPGSAAAAQKAPAIGDAALRNIVAQYQEALNAGNVEQCIKLFRPDAAWLQPDLPITSGQQVLRERFEYLSKEVAIHLQFEPMQVTSSGGWGYADVHITGTTVPKGSKPVAQDNKALFVFRQESDASWRIVRYMVNSNKPGSPPSPR